MRFVEFMRRWNTLPTIPAFKEVLHDQANAMNMVKKSYSSPYSETYNSGWRNHPNFSWRNDNVVASPTHGSSNFVLYNLPPKKVLRTHCNNSCKLNPPLIVRTNKPKMTLGCERPHPWAHVRDRTPSPFYRMLDQTHVDGWSRVIAY